MCYGWQSGNLEEVAWKELKHTGTDLWVWALLCASEALSVWPSSVEWHSAPPIHQKKAQLCDHGFTDYFKSHSELDKNLYHQVPKCRVLKLLKKKKQGWDGSLFHRLPFPLLIWQIAVASVHNPEVPWPVTLSHESVAGYHQNLAEGFICRKEISNVTV